MDLLSVAASVAGPVSLAGQLVPTLYNLGLTVKEVIYSELDAVLKDLHADTGLKAWDRAIWFIKRDSIQDLVLKIQNHKLTFSCMLNILQW
jgi:hypothetical protein